MYLNLVYKILDKQALQASETKEGAKKPRARKPLTIKASTGNGTEEAEVMQEAPAAEKQVAKKGPVRKNIKPVETNDEASEQLAQQLLQATATSNEENNNNTSTEVPQANENGAPPPQQPRQNLSCWHCRRSQCFRL